MILSSWVLSILGIIVISLIIEIILPTGKTVKLIKSVLGVFTIFGITIYKSFLFAILGLICGAVVMELLAFIGKLLVGQRAFGEGDSFIIGSIGALFGLYSLPFIFIASFIIQVISVFPQFIKKII